MRSCCSARATCASLHAVVDCVIIIDLCACSIQSRLLAEARRESQAAESSLRERCAELERQLSLRESAQEQQVADLQKQVALLKVQLENAIQKARRITYTYYSILFLQQERALFLGLFEKFDEPDEQGTVC